MGENKPSNLTYKISVTDTEIFQTLLSYTQALIEILDEYPVSEVDRKKLNDISGEFFSLKRELSDE